MTNINTAPNKYDLEMMNQYKMTFDYHTHTPFSHGKGSVLENVKVAKEKGLEAVAISDHGPGHLSYGIKIRELDEMRRQIDEATKVYKMPVYMSVECNIINKYPYIDVDKELSSKFDFLIGGYHYGVFHGYCVGNYLVNKGFSPFSLDRKLMVKNTEMTVKALYENNLKILTHPGDKGPFDIGEIAEVCAKTGTWMEISTWHKNLTVEEIKIASKRDVSFIISSDAHTANRVGSFLGGLKRAAQAGLDFDRIVNIEKIVK